MTYDQLRQTLQKLVDSPGDADAMNEARAALTASSSDMACGHAYGFIQQMPAPVELVGPADLPENDSGPRFKVWMEGYQASGDSASASYLGSANAPTFLEAARLVWFTRHPDTKTAPGEYQERNGVPSYWGCQMFDNEAEARKFAD